MENTKLGTCKLSASILKDVNLTEDGKIKISDIEVTQQISSINYVDYNGSTPNIVRILNNILAAFKNDPNPPRPPVKNLTVCYEYRQLTPEQEGGVTLFANGTEIANGAVVSAYQGDAVELAVAVDNEYAGFAKWSNGEETSAISFVVDDDTSISAYITKFGTKENPFKIGSVGDLQQLADDVLGGDCKEGVFFKQTADIDMDGIAWNGIGLTDPTSSQTRKYDPDPNHSFKGVYDGNGKLVKNLTLHCVTDDTKGYANRYKALFRAAGWGAVIKNLTVNVNGVDNWVKEDIMAAAIVGVTNGGLTIENCTANGTLGTSEHPLDNSSGILCRIAVPPAHQDPYTVTLTNVTNNVDIIGICKIGGIISYGYGTMNLNNVVNTGDLTRTAGSAPPADHYIRYDGVGGIIGFGHQDGGHMNYNFNGVKNTGKIITDFTPTYAQYAGQIAGKWSVMNATNAGDVVVLNSNDIPAAKACPTTGSDNLVGALPIYLGKLGADGYLHGVSTLENGSEYVYMAANISESSGNVVTGPAYTLPNGATITVEHRFGTPNIVSESGTSITGTLVSGNIYEYVA